MIKPFSILDSRAKEWQDRKRWWINTYGIKSELGRENTISKSRFWDTEENTVSIFDATLCEKMYEWFALKGGKVLDPFAGGSVRGIIATEMGLGYDGIDLSQTQIEANRLQSEKPNWIFGDSDKELTLLEDESYDYVFTCPPYHDLEIYSDSPDDLSNMEYQKFLEKYKSIIKQTYNKLKPNRFFTIVVSEIRELTKTGSYKIGSYKGFVPDTIKICEDVGYKFYNDMILINSQHSASRVGDTYFERNRKVPSVHQNVLTFVKGNPDLATEDLEWDGEYKCIVEGKKYKSFREAAISIDADTLVASEVERRCLSPKIKYKDWQIIGEETNPVLKISLDGYLFESPIHASNYIDMSVGEIRNRIYSTNPLYRHWLQLEEPITNITYEENQKSLEGVVIREQLHTIKCEGIDFYSIKEAAQHFGISDERIRQKLVSSDYNDYIYLY